MPFEISSKTGKVIFSFANFLATVVVLGCFIYFFWISGSSGQSENRDIGEIKTALIGVLTLVLGYYYGSTKSTAGKDAQIKELQTDAKDLALATSGVNIDHATEIGKSTNIQGDTRVDTLNAENISGNVVADKLVVPSDMEVEKKKTTKKQ